MRFNSWLYISTYHKVIMDNISSNNSQLYNLITSIAEYQEQEYKDYCDNDIDGFDYALIAAENQMHTNEYFKARVYDRELIIVNTLDKLDDSVKEIFYIAAKLINSYKNKDEAPPSPNVTNHVIESVISDDDFPF